MTSPLRELLRRIWLALSPTPSYPIAPTVELLPAILPTAYRPIERVVLADQVERSLFQDFVSHRQGSRRQEEIGWVLLGLRRENDAVVQAALPAGAFREAGVAHVQFNATAQAVGSRFVRQSDKRLGIVGVVHTHPGSLRHPSGGDYDGDRHWVGRLRGGEGVFAIGTADVRSGESFGDHQQCEGELLFSWYALAGADQNYRRLRVETVPGPDLARPLAAVWDTVERHADVLEVLARQQAGFSIEATPGAEAGSFSVKLALAEPGSNLKLLFQKERVRYYVCQGQDVFAVDTEEPAVDRAVYQILAELSRQRTTAS